MTGNSNKYCVIHGHFYQPPRESPWLGEIQRQPSAAPYHNWNERIFDECYRTNAFSRILNNEGKITGVINNYSYMSFNFGPTLFKWLEKKNPVVYRRIVGADRRSCEAYEGHGSAVAQVYNHTILPHATKRDKLTQIRWSKTFFKRHFNREPESMWLAETAINNETVECLIEEGIKFVILSPNQAEAFSKGLVKQESDAKWVSVNEKGIDPRYSYRAYAYDRTGERKGGYLDVFFFDEPLSRAVSFENLLDNADILTDRIGLCYDLAPKDNQVVTLATDGETFGHHKKNGDMCLAYFFRKKAEEAGIKVVNLAYYLSKNPPVREVKLKNARGEGTAWSCAHGTGRWIRDCGCNTGGQAGWNQQWRGPLREAMDYLNEEMSFVFEKEMGAYFTSPWEIRDAYEPFIDEKEGLEEFLQEQAKKEIPQEKIGRMIMLLEAQVYVQYSYTSCAWFFNDISGIETVQNIKYALRAWQLVWPGVSTNHIFERFRSILEEAKSNFPCVNGATILDTEARNMIYHLERAAFTAIINNYIYEDKTDYQLDFYNISIDKFTTITIDGREWLLFDVDVSHTETREERTVIIALYSSRGRNIEGVLLDHSLKKELSEGRNFKDVIDQKAIRKFSLKDVFEPYCEALTDRFIGDFARDTLLDYISWAGQHNSRLDAITELNGGLPDALSGTVAFFLNKEWDLSIRQLVNLRFSEVIKTSLDDVVQKAKHYGIEINKEVSADLFDKWLIDTISALSLEDNCSETLEAVVEKLYVVREYAIPIRLKQVQDAFYLFYREVVFLYKENYKGGKTLPPEKKHCLQAINTLAESLGFSCEKTAV